MSKPTVPAAWAGDELRKMERQRDALLEALKAISEQLANDNTPHVSQAADTARAAIASVESPTTHRTD